MDYKIGETVKVKVEITDPDFNTSIAGWSGRIIEIDRECKMLLLEWDSPTLVNMPDGYIRHSLDNGYDYKQYFIEMKDVEKIPPRDKLQDVRDIHEELEARYHDYELYGDPPYPFSEVERGEFNDTYGLPQSYGRWLSFLEEKLSFPFEAEVTESHGRIRMGHRLKVLDLNDYEDPYGIIVDCKDEDGHLVNFLLCDLEAVDEKSDNYHWLRRYVIWFANR